MRAMLPRLLIVSLVAGLVYWLGSYIEFYEKDVDIGFRGEARANHFLAADYFLKAMGQDTRKLDVYRESIDLLDTKDTLIMTGQRVSMGKDRSKRLLQWVNSGGFLIVTARTYIDGDDRAHDYILDSLGITGHYIYLDDEQFADSPVDVSIDENIEFLLVGFKKYYSLQIPDSTALEIIWSIENESLIHAIPVAHGKGRVIVLSDMSIFHNSEISSYDNAAFLWGLVNDKPTIGTVNYSLFETRQSLLNWLYTTVPYFVLTLLVFMVLFIWHVAPRFGPVIDVDHPNRSNFIEHILAIGNYYWRNKSCSRLLQFSQQSVLQDIYSKFPDLVMSDRKQLIVTLNNHISDSAIDFDHVLFNPNVSSNDDFLKKIKSLEYIRKAI